MNCFFFCRSLYIAGFVADGCTESNFYCSGCYMEMTACYIGYLTYIDFCLHCLICSYNHYFYRGWVAYLTGSFVYMGWAVYSLVVDSFYTGWLVFDLFVDNFVYMGIAWEICCLTDFYRNQNDVIVYYLTRWVAVCNKGRVTFCYDLVAACLNNMWNFFVAIRVAYLHIVLLHYSAVVGT